MSFVYNAWYVAGWSSDFGTELKPVTILEHNLVFYRTAAGTLTALEDRCPHRALPLSRGKRIGDTIQCGYHGLTFNAEGRCVRIPGQASPPPRSAVVRRYPTCERNAIVWVWMGDPQASDPNTIFDLEQFHDPTWCAHQGDALSVRSNYRNVVENLIDPAHVSFVHPTTLGSAASEDVPVNVDLDSTTTITAWRWIRNAPPIGFFKQFGRFTGDVDRWHYYHLHLPTIAVIDFGSVDSIAASVHDDRDKGIRVFVLHFLTPVNASETIDHWMHLRNTAVDDPDAAEQINVLLRTAFAEDKLILEAIQDETERRPLQRGLRLAIDKAPLAYQHRIDALIAAEQNNGQAL